ncbi:hypothetical protein [Streptomyces sp. NPDC002788]
MQTRGKAGFKSPAPSVAFVDGPYYFIDPKTSRVLEQSSDLGDNPRVRTTYLAVGWTDRIG